MGVGTSVEQAADTAIVAFATHDADEANAVCLLLGKAGWPTLRRRFSGGPDDAVCAAEIGQARCLIIVWSSSAAPLQRMQFAAERAHRLGAMIALRLDDSVFPIETAAPLNFTGWPHEADLALCEAFLTEVATRLGPPPLRAIRARHRQRPSEEQRLAPQKAAGSTISAARALRAVKTRRRGGWLMGMTGAAAALGLSAFGLAALDPHGLGSPFLSVVMATETLIEEPLAGGPAAAPMAGIDTSDPQRLRGFLQAHGSGAQSSAAERALAELEAKDWLQVRAANDAENALSAIAKFRATYPDGRNAAAAADLEADWRALKEEVEAQLVRLGYTIQPSEGLLHPQTRASVRSFQAGQGMPPDGKVDRALLFVLKGVKTNPLAMEPSAPPPLPAP